MATNNKNSAIPGTLFTGVFALLFALVACLYLFRNDQSKIDPEPDMALDELITEPLPPIIPGLWQIAY